MDHHRGPPYRGGPKSGETMTGMVKSYNRKGFGFIMCQTMDQDIYFSRESLHPQLQTSDLAGESVTFEVHRFPDGKMQARNLRPVGDVSAFHGGSKTCSYGKGNRTAFLGKGALSRDSEEDRSRDWYCKNCSERNFVKRFECFKCKAQRPPEGPDGTYVAPAPPRRNLSPHAGSRAMRESFIGKRGVNPAAIRSRSRNRKRKSPARGRTPSSSGSRSRKRGKKSKKKLHSSPSRSRSKSRNKKRKSRSKSSSSGSAASSSSSPNIIGAAASSAADGDRDPNAPSGNPEVEKAKAEALAKLMKLRELEPKEARMREFRALLRQWHPDKNPSKTEVATAVFQFLQKGKLLMEASS